MTNESPTKLLPTDTALVTGAASGIGRSVAIALAREGTEVILTDVDAIRGEEVAADVRKAGCRARFLPSDLSSTAGTLDLLGRTRKLTREPLSIFVHSASPRRKEADHVMAVDEATWQAMLEVNVHAGFTLSREIAKTMIARHIRGRMLFITSLHAESPRNLPHYSAAKAGQTMLVKELARALGPHGIRVNAIAPGAIPGGGFDAKGAGIERLERCTSLKRLGKPEEIAGMAVALLAERFSSYVTGTTVVVDGGIALHNWIEPFDG
jgi:NAD(P)-dependent dehydrogenase (short-subunit alcohol dehydrogenase family)